jgi:hypothetical protein
MFLTGASVVVLALAPAAAVARQHRHHHHRRSHHFRVLHERFGALTAAAATPGSSSTQQTPEPPAGTVADFSGGILTITLSDGSTVKGSVTGDTEIECRAAASSGSDDSSEGGDARDIQREGDDNQGEDAGEQSSSCGTADLAPGATVAGAQLTLSGSGAVWNQVVIVK